MSQENVEIVQRAWDLFTERIDQDDPATASDAGFDQGLIAPTSTLTPAPEVPPYKTYVGREGYAEFLRAWLEDFVEWRIGLEKIIDAGDDRVVAVVRQSAKGKGSGASVELQFSIVITLKDCQIIDERHYLDTREALEAVGLRE